MHNKKIRIGVDLMGNDNSPETLLNALRGLKLSSNAELILFGLALLQKEKDLLYVTSPEFIEMDEPPLVALRRKKNSSICEGLRQLKAGKIDAFVSAGNTGALVSGARMILGKTPKVLQPALLARMPTKKQPVAVLDVGASIQAKASHLIQYAFMGAAYCKVQGISKPRIGLLNIGSEAIKGTSEIRLAYQELQKMTSFHFAGNIEGKSVFDGDVDVLVTDGFTGNVFLKTGEGIASLILDRFDALLSPIAYQKLHPQIQDLQHTLHYAQNPGALLAGVKGIVIKCHGYSTPQAFVNAVLGSIELVAGGFSQAIEKQIDKSITERSV